MRKYIILVIVLLYKMTCLAQEMPKVLPPSPEAASVFKFSEVPVSLYTGLPNIEIPLFEIESGGVKVPISLSYHARGIKVAEIASRVGLGWTLNAGGMISRQVRDKTDGTVQDAYQLEYFTSAAARRHISLMYSGDPEAWYDFIPDQYYFNTGTGLIGKFIYDYTDGQILAQNYSNVKVHSVGKITDDKGNQYLFQEGDYDLVGDNYAMSDYSGGYTLTNANGQSININTWHLQKIITQTGQEINFIYENEETRYLRRSYDNFEPGYNVPNSMQGGLNNIPAQNRSYSTQIQSVQQRIKEITFDKGRVVFEYHTVSREDFMYGGNYLKKITLYNNAGAIIQQKVLAYEYTNSADIDSNSNMNQYLRMIDAAASKRLFLKSVQTISNANNVVPPYQFEYNTSKLPSRHSNSLDTWGYYNGQQNGQFLSQTYTSIGARTVNEDKSAAGLLKKIIYPTGGSVNFYYEHNRVFSNYPKKTVFFDSPNPLVKKTLLLTPLGHAEIDPLRNQPIYSQSEHRYKKAFVISQTSVSNFKFKNISGVSDCGVLNNNNCLFYVQIHRLEDGGFVCQLPVTTNNQYHKMVMLNPGSYTLSVIPISPTYNPSNFNSENMTEWFSVNMEWIEEVADTNDPIFAGGKRIQKIEYRDAQNNIGLTKTYDYTDPDTGKSSGLLFGLPNFFGVKQVVTTLLGQTFNLLQPFGNIPGAPLSTYQEASLGYGVVTEYIGEGANTIGKSVHRFTMTPETGDFYSFPYHPPADHEWLRGKELSVTNYRRNDNGIYEPVKKIENEYLYGGDTVDSSPAVFYSLPYRKLIDENLNCPAPGSGQPIELYCTHSAYKKNNKMFRLPLSAMYYESDGSEYYKVYQLTGGTVDLWKTKTTDYFDNDTKIETLTTFDYDYDNHYNLAKAISSNSTGGTNETRYYYASDPEMVSKPCVDSLKVKNVIGVPLVTQSYKNTEKLSEQETVYKDWGNSLFLPEILKSSKGSNGLENRIKYNIYNKKGKPLEIQQESGIKISYIWGYNKTQPIAKIENATNSQIASALGVSDLNSVTESSLSAINNLRSNANLTNSMITTYTYIPLVGVSTITDPKGDTITYFYDSFGRLQSVKDKDENILSENQYNYKPN